MTKNKRKIAAVSLTMNDDYKIKEWIQWYQEYKEDLGLFIIVDNNSTLEYRQKLAESFPKAHIIELGYNGGCTGAYNAGIKYALEDPEVTHIALIGNDCRLESGALEKCADLLDSDPELGMVAPVLLEADSDIVSDFGCEIGHSLNMIPFGVGCHVEELKEHLRYCSAVTGGMNVAKRDFYESVGLQDENLFMYSDEVDMGLRASKKGFKFAVLRDARSWHQHINQNKSSNRRHPFSKYLIARNKTYLAMKHYGFAKSFEEVSYFMFNALKLSVIHIMKGEWTYLKDDRWQLWGAVNGLVGNMRPNKYSHI